MINTSLHLVPIRTFFTPKPEKMDLFSITISAHNSHGMIVLDKLSSSCYIYFLEVPVLVPVFVPFLLLVFSFVVLVMFFSQKSSF